MTDHAKPTCAGAGEAPCSDFPILAVRHPAGSNCNCQFTGTHVRLNVHVENEAGKIGHFVFGCGAARREPKGTFIEDVIAAASDYNAKALENLEAALASLDQRTKDRKAKDVEGTHKD